ncbi:hypothetical protein GDO81_013612 [Engystomops pustulosus]|uniref:Uncharacterized protein n=1 Tax=Engystomops pustulosus TaxID=76066 RepID=A0AAV7B1P1_ENGPU|nr:hypothetical protein GDO81_013612 [Engystomops pustulosus]
MMHYTVLASNQNLELILQFNPSILGFLFFYNPNVKTVLHYTIPVFSAPMAVLQNPASWYCQYSTVWFQCDPFLPCVSLDIK